MSIRRYVNRRRRRERRTLTRQRSVGEGCLSDCSVFLAIVVSVIGIGVG